MLSGKCRYSLCSMKAKDFETRVLSLSDRIYPMAARMLGSRSGAEDAVQEIMMKLWERRSKIGDHPNIKGYVFLTARNYCLDLLKRKEPEVDALDFQMKVLKSEGSHSQVEWEELNTIIEGLLTELPAPQREVMMLRDIDGLEFVEIAAATNLNIEHVRVLLSRARKHVGKKLKKIYSYE